MVAGNKKNIPSLLRIASCHNNLFQVSSVQMESYREQGPPQGERRDLPPTSAAALCVIQPPRMEAQHARDGVPRPAG